MHLYNLIYFIRAEIPPSLVHKEYPFLTNEADALAFLTIKHDMFLVVFSWNKNLQK